MKCRYVKFYYGEECEYIYCFDQNMDDDKILTEYKVAVKIALLRRTWDEALDLVANKLKEIKEKFGPDSIGFLTSARATNEENYIAQKFTRATLGTNNIDHCARL